MSLKSKPEVFVKFKRRPIYVEWKDATTNSGWHYNGDCTLMDCFTLGFMMFEDKDKIVVCATRSDDDGMISSNTIPKKWITKRKWVKL